MQASNATVPRCRGRLPKSVPIILLLAALSATAVVSIADPVTDAVALTGKQAPIPVAVPPSPTSLTADWWRYFDVEPTVLKERVDIVMRRLDGLRQALPEGEKQQAAAALLRFAENLRTLVALRANPGPEPPHVPSFAETYSLSRWLAIVNKQRTAQVELQSEHEDLLRSEKRLAATRQRLDTLTASYLALPAQSPLRVTQGLTLMALWSDMAVGSEGLRLKKAALEQAKRQLEHLVAENAAARERLFINADELKRLQEELAKEQRQLAAKREEATRLANVALPADLETDAGKARALLLEQQLRYGSIQEAIAAARVSRKTVELQLAQLLTAPENRSVERFRTQLRDGKAQMADIGTKLELWREEAERDQGRTGTALANMLTNPAQQNEALIAVTQQRLLNAQDTLLALQRLDGELRDARLLAEHVRGLIAVREGAFRSGLETVRTSTAKVWELIRQYLQASLFKIGEAPVTLLGILRVLLVITLAWGLSHFVRRGLTHLGEHQRGSSAFLYTIGRLAHYLILVIGISIGLSSIGVDLSNFALIAGALSLGMGFGLQAIVSNFVSGLIVLFERSLRVGDFVELSSGIAGEVRAVNVRSTLVTTPDMVDILVPNSEFVNGKVINWTLTDASRRIHIPFGVAYGTDKERVRTAALEAAQRTPYTVKEHWGREPQVWLINFGESSLDFELVVWVQPGAVKRPQMVRAAYYWELETALKAHGIVIPFPQRDLHLRSGFQAAPPVSTAAGARGENVARTTTPLAERAGESQGGGS